MLNDPQIIDFVIRGEIEVEQLGWEASRRCPFNCEHCYHGAPENVVMTPEAMDLMLSKFNGIPVKYMNLHGGEYSTDIRTLENVAYALDRNKTEFHQFGLVTNGVGLRSKTINNFSNKHKRFFDILDFIAELSVNKAVRVEMSDDPPHLKEYNRLGLEFDKHKEVFLSNNNPRIRTSMQHNENLSSFADYGNAKTMQDIDKYRKYRTIKMNDIDLRFEQCLTSNKKVLLRNITFDAKNNVTPSITEYAAGDKINFGNIHRDDLTQIFLDHGHEYRSIGYC